jgi:predicted RNA polymerase sigma factor
MAAAQPIPAGPVTERPGAPANPEDRPRRVLEVNYLIFNEGYSPTAGEALVRPELMDEALRLGRILAELLPREAEVHGLVSPMELQAARTRARISPSGDQVLLLDQDRPRPDWVLVGRGLAALDAHTRPAVRSGRTRCRPVSRPATRVHACPRTPTGNGSRPSTTGWPS